ncbi:FAD-dependent oxidoreductase [Paraburkholderia fungorum]|uniref:FAD-dependent oxidoreductase n=1 Tax=Paraburkholderia fungorum TaxID=134537 RepID=UPI0038BCF2C5
MPSSNTRSVRPERIQTLKDEVRDTFPGVTDGTDTPAEWVGLRPATPTGLPIISQTRYKNLWVNVGHGALGFTLAAGAARPDNTHARVLR